MVEIHARGARRRPVIGVVYVARGALPRAGGIQEHLDRVATSMGDRGYIVRVLAARIDDQPFTRLNTTLRVQKFPAFVHDRVTTEPFPLSTRRRVRMLPVALTAVPGIDRLGLYHRLREATLSGVIAALSPGFAWAFMSADVVHAMGGEAQAHAALAVSRHNRLPFVITPFAHPGFWGDDELNLRLYREADAVVALLDGEARWLEEKGVDRAKIHVIGVAAPEAPALISPISVTKPLVLCLGVKRPYKYRLLLEAIKHVKRSDVRFAFVGPRTPDWDRDISSIDDPRVLDIPKVDEREKWEWLAAADLLCLASVSEIMPVTILEAWRNGRPVVVARGRWTADLVDDGQNGTIVPPQAEAVAEAIEALLADPARAHSMGESGRLKVEAKYAAAAVSAAHERLYRSLEGAKG